MIYKNSFYNESRSFVFINNPEAKIPTYNELIEFLKHDKTDMMPFIEDDFMCVDYAAILHNNAEKSGYICAFVLVDFEDDPEMHAINAFKTVDQGLIFIDSSGVRDPSDDLDGYDSIVSLKIGKPYSGFGICENYAAPELSKIVCAVYLYW